MKKQSIHIVDINGGNLASLHHALTRLGNDVCITQNPIELERATKIILPGIGHFKNAMTFLETQRLRPILDHLVLEKRTPILGICLGMQLMANHSEEGNEAGLGWIDANCIAFPIENGSSLKSIHSGWNQVEPQTAGILLENCVPANEFFFLHKFHLTACAHTKGQTTYGVRFPSVIERENIMGIQFHPEKSHANGLQLLTNFCHV